MLPNLLKAYWILASSAVLLTILPFPVPQAFKSAVRLAAARGKLWHGRPKVRALGWLEDISVPQQFFEHFYLVGALVTTVCLQVYIFVCCEDEPGSTQQRDSLLALLLFEVHVLRRYLETAYLMHYPDTARMHLLAYLFGLTYYVAAPLSLLPPRVLRWEVVRGAWDMAMGAGASHFKSVDARLYAAATEPHPGLPRVLAAALLFFVASLLQFVAHVALSRLARAGSKRAAEAAAAAAMVPQPGPAGEAPAVPVTQLYSVPRGGLFEWVSCPHYLAEVLLYGALALATGGSPASLLMGAWVLLNLVLAAGATRRWYAARFPDYPKGRAALIPGLW